MTLYVKLISATYCIHLKTALYAPLLHVGTMTRKCLIFVAENVKKEKKKGATGGLKDQNESLLTF